MAIKSNWKYRISNYKYWVPTVLHCMSLLPLFQAQVPTQSQIHLGTCWWVIWWNKHASSHHRVCKSQSPTKFLISLWRLKEIRVIFLFRAHATSYSYCFLPESQGEKETWLVITKWLSNKTEEGVETWQAQPLLLKCQSDWSQVH